MTQRNLIRRVAVLGLFMGFLWQWEKYKILPAFQIGQFIKSVCSPAHHSVHTTFTSYMKTLTEGHKLLFTPQILFTPQQSVPTQSTDLIRGISASPSIYKLCIVATHFIFFSWVQHTRAWLPLYLCDGDISSMTWGPFTLSFQHSHTSFSASWRCLGSAATIWGSIQTYNAVSFVATYQHQPHLFNSDLEGEARAWAEVLMIQSPSHRAYGTKETMETNSPPRDTWIISDKSPPFMVLPPWIIYLCKGLDQLVNLSTAAHN